MCVVTMVVRISWLDEDEERYWRRAAEPRRRAGGSNADMASSVNFVVYTLVKEIQWFLYDEYAAKTKIVLFAIQASQVQGAASAHHSSQRSGLCPPLSQPPTSLNIVAYPLGGSLTRLCKKLAGAAASTSSPSPRRESRGSTEGRLCAILRPLRMRD